MTKNICALLGWCIAHSFQSSVEISKFYYNNVKITFCLGFFLPSMYIYLCIFSDCGFAGQKPRFSKYMRHFKPHYKITRDISKVVSFGWLREQKGIQYILHCYQFWHQAFAIHCWPSVSFNLGIAWALLVNYLVCFNYN